jgi:glutathione S-transferase
MYDLYIANKNYSSWSLRPWVLMREMDIPFTEHLIPFGETARWDAYRRLAPNGKVPCLVHGDVVVWDSLAIVEYLAERHETVWPTDRISRAWARSAAAEMHSGFSEIRNRCSMTCGVRVRLNEFPAALEREIARLGTLWEDGLTRFGGSFLAGDRFTAVDAFYAPVAFRIRSYDLELSEPAAAYGARLLELPAMQDWYNAGIQETYRDQSHEDEMLMMGRVLEDVRSTVN